MILLLFALINRWLPDTAETFQLVMVSLIMFGGFIFLAKAGGIKIPKLGIWNKIVKLLNFLIEKAWTLLRWICVSSYHLLSKFYTWVKKQLDNNTNLPEWAKKLISVVATGFVLAIII